MIADTYPDLSLNSNLGKCCGSRSGKYQNLRSTEETRQDTMLLTRASAEVTSRDPLAERGILDLYVPLKPQNLPAALLMMYLPP